MQKTRSRSDPPLSPPTCAVGFHLFVSLPLSGPLPSLGTLPGGNLWFCIVFLSSLRTLFSPNLGFKLISSALISPVIFFSGALSPEQNHRDSFFFVRGPDSITLCPQIPPSRTWFSPQLRFLVVPAASKEHFYRPSPSFDRLSGTEPSFSKKSFMNIRSLLSLPSVDFFPCKCTGPNLVMYLYVFEFFMNDSSPLSPLQMSFLGMRCAFPHASPPCFLLSIFPSEGRTDFPPLVVVLIPPSF